MRWVISVVVGVVVGLVAALVVLALASWVWSSRPEHVWLTIIAGLVAGAAGACAQALHARESLLEQLAKRLPPEFIFPTVMALVGLSAILLASKSGGTFEEKLLYTIAVVVVVGLCVACGLVFPLVKRKIAKQEKALKLAAQVEMFRAATHAIKDKPEFKEDVERVCFEVVDFLQVEPKPRRRSLPPPAPGGSD